MSGTNGKREILGRLLEIVERLRGPGGCPWDRRQTLSSLARHVLEEAYELVEAIEGGDPGAVCEEIGDLLMILLLLARVAEEQGTFDIGDAAGGIARKLVRRHPHVFGDVVAATEREVLANWEAIKRREKPDRRSPADGIPRGAPALAQAYRLAERASRTRSAWQPRPLEEAWQAARGARGTSFREALGALLVALAWEARERGVDPEGALRAEIGRVREALEAEAGTGPAPGPREGDA